MGRLGARIHRPGSPRLTPLGISLATLERWFKAPVLLRAQALPVEDLHAEQDAALTRIRAQVRGSQLYDVELLLQPGAAPRGRCVCAYAARGWPCKHQAALALAWRKQKADPVGDALHQVQALERSHRHREALAVLEATLQGHPGHEGLEAQLLAAYERDGWEEEALRLRRRAFERQGGRTQYLALLRATQAAGAALDPDTLWAPLDAQIGRAAAAHVLQQRLVELLPQAKPPFGYELALVQGALARMEPAQGQLWLAWLKLTSRTQGPAWRQALAGLHQSRPRILGQRHPDQQP